MAISYDEVAALKKELEDEYQPRHRAFRNLRRYWNGDYWKLADAESNQVISVFRDFTARDSDVGPDIKLVHNVIQMVCVKYQTFLAPLPQIHVYPDPPETDRKRAQATTKERYLYGTWAGTDMAQANANVGWYLPLMGNCFHGIFPDFTTKTPKVLLRSPEYAYPVPDFQGDTQAFMFAWKLRESVVKRTYPDYVGETETLAKRGVFRKRGQETDPLVELLEYSDPSEFSRFISSQRVNGVEHNFGWNLFEHMKFITVPDEIWGHGAVEQSINLNEMGNALYSLMFQAVVENVFPRLVLIDPAKAPEEIETGPGAVIPINAGGSVEWLHPPTQMIPAQQNFARQNDQNILEASGMNRVNFGESPATSIVTGKAVNELQGAGTGSTIEMVQGVGLGDAMESWNEKAIRIGQEMFDQDTINLYGLMPLTGHDLVPARFSMSVKGSQLVGGTRNEVIFSPAMGQHEKLVMWLQAKGGGLVSDEYIRTQVGITDSEAMDEAIFAEAVDKAVLGFILQQFEQQPEPGNVEKVEQQAAGLLAGRVEPHPLLAQPAMPGGQGLAALPPGGPQGGPPPTAGPSPAAAPPGPTPPVPQGATAPAGPGGPGGPTTLQQAVAAFQGVRGITGKVFLVGEIVATGQTGQEIEVALTERADEDTLTRSLPQFQIGFHVIAGEPTEPFVEVTPGKAPRQGGNQPQQAAAVGQ